MPTVLQQPSGDLEGADVSSSSGRRRSSMDSGSSISSASADSGSSNGLGKQPNGSPMTSRAASPDNRAIRVETVRDGNVPIAESLLSCDDDDVAPATGCFTATGTVVAASSTSLSTTLGISALEVAMGDSNYQHPDVRPAPIGSDNGIPDKRCEGIFTLSTKYRGSTVSYHDIHYKVAVRGSKCCTSKYKKVLDGVSGVFKPGTMNAIMGPTGCGKSSLLDILAGRKNKQGISGLVLIDGKKQPDDFRLMSGYVVQDDLITGTLTVRENLLFSANLRLPSTLSAKEKADRVDRIINELGLTKCADTKIGNEFVRGVSGGERKRTNIGMELVTSPRVLFLDEPTTGLDSNTAKSVLLLLQRLAHSGSTIIFSIHQPRFSIYKLCDTLHLLGNGETIYFGPSLQGMDFFRTLGYTIEEHDNPADFYLDVINGEEVSPQLKRCLPPAAVAVTGAGDSCVKISDNPRRADSFEVVVDNDDDDDDDSSKALRGPTKLRTSMFATAYRNSVWNTWLRNDLLMITDGVPPASSKSSGDVVAEVDRNVHQTSYHVSFAYQFFVVCGRTLKNFLRNPRTSYMQVLTACFFAVVTGAIYFGVDDSCDSGIQNRVGAFFFITMNMVFGNLSAVDLFIQERSLFAHEHASGFYRVSCYFLSKVVCDIVPNRALPAVAYSLITYWMIGFYPDVGNFFFFLLNLVLTSLVACSLSFAISAAVRQSAVANLLIGLCYVIMMVFSGLLVNIKKIGEWLKWLQWFSIFRYSLRAVSINELKDRNFYAVVNGTSVDMPDCSGNAYLTKQGISYEEGWDLWQNEVAMAAMAAILLAIAYLQLRFGVAKT